MIALAVAATLGACRHGEPAPSGDIAATLAHTPRADGGAFDPASLTGKPSLVLFVSPTCSHCLATIPRAAAAAKARGANVVAVFVIGKAKQATSVASYLHFPGAVLVDDGSLRKRYEIHGVPYILVLGADGHARAAYLGEQSQGALEDALADAG